MPRCWIGLGGNVGDVADTFRMAMDALSHAYGVTYVSTSPIYRTQPMGVAAGHPFLNAVAGFDVTRPALELLDLLQTVEQLAGRVRTVHWGPRTLDLDLLYFGDEIVKHPRLNTPHPGLWYRRFVLDPLADVAPHWVDPVWQMSVALLRDRLRHPPRCLTVFGADSGQWEDLRSLIDTWPHAVELRDNDVAAALQGGLVVQIGPVVTPQVPRFRFEAGVSPTMVRETLSAAATAAFDEPERL